MHRLLSYLAQFSAFSKQGELLSTQGKGYQRRYVCRAAGPKGPCFSLGVRDPFKKRMTPFWLRFHHDTPLFAVIRGRLAAPTVSERWVERGGHVWIPLDVPLNADGEQIINALVTQTAEIAGLHTRQRRDLTRFPAPGEDATSPGKQPARLYSSTRPELDATS